MSPEEHDFCSPESARAAQEFYERYLRGRIKVDWESVQRTLDLLSTIELQPAEVILHPRPWRELFGEGE